MIPTLVDGTLRQAAAGHREAADLLVRFIYAYTSIISRGSRLEVNDLTQEIFIKLLTAVRAKQFDPELAESESSWVVASVRNAIIDAHRKAVRTRARFPLDHDLSSTDVADTIDIEAEVAEDQQNLSRKEKAQRAVNALDEADRMLLALKYGAELSDEDVARQMKIPPGTVKSRIHRLKEKLQRSVKWAPVSTS